MEFSPTVACTESLVEWSPNGTMIAHAVKARLFVRDSATLKVTASFCCLDVISQLCWSPHSDFLAASIHPLGITHIFTPSDPEWHAKITEGPVGLTSVSFAPDSRHLLSMSELNLKLTIWSLVSKNVRCIKHPKCFDFSGDGLYLAVVEKCESGSRENVGIYDTESWQEVARMGTDCLDTSGILWAPGESEKLVVWDGAVNYLFQIFSLSGSLLLTFPDAGDSSPTLGIRTLRWSPCGQLLAVGGYNDTIKVFNALSFSFITDLEHCVMFSTDDMMTRNCSVFEEKLKMSKDIDKKIVDEWMNLKTTEYESVGQRPAKLSRKSIDPKKLSSSGISMMRFSKSEKMQDDCGSLYLASRNASMPSAVFIWDLQKLELTSVLVHLDPVCAFEWEPGFDRLLLVTGGHCAHVWSPLGACVVRIPTSAEGSDGLTGWNESEDENAIRLNRVTWNPQGKTLLLIGKDGFMGSKIVKRTREQIEKY